MSGHPGAPRDVDLDDWIASAAYHPANTTVKQKGHELARKAVVALAQLLHWLLPPGRAKSLAYTHLELVRLYANMALAVGGGPDPERFGDAELDAALRTYGYVRMPEDQRIAETKATQLTEPESRLPGAAPDAPASGMTGRTRTDAAEPGVYAEKDAMPDSTFDWVTKDEDVSLRVKAYPGFVGITCSGRRVDVREQAGPDGEWGYAFDLITPLAVNELLSALAAAGDRAFTR